MFVHFRRVIVVSVITVFTLCCSTACAQFFEDNFDGEANVTWEAFPGVSGAGERQIVDGKYMISPGSKPNGIDTDLLEWVESDSRIANRNYGQVSITSEFRVQETSRYDYWVGLFALSQYDPSDGSGHSLFTVIGEQGLIGVMTSQNGITDENYQELLQTSLRPHEGDILVRLDVYEDTAELWTWAEGTQMPMSPMLTLDLPDYLSSEGGIGVFALHHESRPTSYEFEFFNAAPVPEPATSSMVLGVAVALLYHRKSRYPSVHMS